VFFNRPASRAPRAAKLPQAASDIRQPQQPHAQPAQRTATKRGKKEETSFGGRGPRGVLGVQRAVLKDKSGSHVCDFIVSAKWQIQKTCIGSNPMLFCRLCVSHFETAKVTGHKMAKKTCRGDTSHNADL